MNTDNAARSETGKGRGDSPLSGLVHRTDLTLAIVILAICGILYYITYGFEEASAQMSQNIPPEWFPRLLLIFIAGLALVIPFEHRFLEKGKAGLDKDRRSRIKPVAGFTAVLLCLIVGLMPWLGTFLTMLLVCVLLPLLWGEHRLKILLPFAILFPGLVTILFTKVLGVYFEPGIWATLF